MPGEARGQASGQDLLAFRSLYDATGEGPGEAAKEGGEAGGGRGRGGESGEGNPSRPESAPFPMPWAGPLWAGPGLADPAAGSVPLPGQAPAEVPLPELASELIGRLLVKDGESAAPGQEVRILLRHCALEGTEVHFRRGEDGLHLAFLPDSPAGGDLLRRKSDSLESLLKARLAGENVTVSVLDPDDARRPATGPRG